MIRQNLFNSFATLKPQLTAEAKSLNFRCYKGNLAFGSFISIFDMEHGLYDFRLVPAERQRIETINEVPQPAAPTAADICHDLHCG